MAVRDKSQPHLEQTYVRTIDYPRQLSTNWQDIECFHFSRSRADPKYWIRWNGLPARVGTVSLTGPALAHAEKII